MRRTDIVLIDNEFQYWKDRMKDKKEWKIWFFILLNNSKIIVI
jgi:hypothetical protein